MLELYYAYFLKFSKREPSGKILSFIHVIIYWFSLPFSFLYRIQLYEYVTIHPSIILLLLDIWSVQYWIMSPQIFLCLLLGAHMYVFVRCKPKSGMRIFSFKQTLPNSFQSSCTIYTPTVSVTKLTAPNFLKHLGLSVILTLALLLGG